MPYEAALAMLEVEGEVLAAPLPSSPHPSDGGAAVTAVQPGLAVVDCEAISRKLVHAFPWSPAASVHLALALRRKATPALGSVARLAARTSGGTSVTVIGPRGGQYPSNNTARRKFLIRVWA